MPLSSDPLPVDFARVHFVARELGYILNQEGWGQIMLGFLKGHSTKSQVAGGEIGVGPDLSADVLPPSLEVGSRGQIEEMQPTQPEPATAPPDRYEVRGDDAVGCSVYDNETGTTAETYGYQLVSMSRTRAASLVAVLNRGEARRRAAILHGDLDVVSGDKGQGI